MVTVRYIKKDGKLHGPYYYRSFRDSNGKVNQVYLGRSNPDEVALQNSPPINKFNNKFLIAFLVVSFLIGFAFLFQFFGNNVLTGNYVFDVNKLVSSSAVLEIDGVSSPMPLELIKIGEDWYYNITTLDLNLSSGLHVVKVIDNSIIVFEQNVTVGNVTASSAPTSPVASSQPIAPSSFGTQSFNVQSATDYPSLNFTNPTPANGSSIVNTSLIVNVSVVSSNALNSFVWNWNGTNYTIYNDSLVLIMNFENLSSLGENATKVADMSKYSNNGTAYNGTIINSTNGKYGGGIYFDGQNDFVNIINSNSTASTVSVNTSNTNGMTINLWMKPNLGSIGSNTQLILDKTGGDPVTNGEYSLAFDNSSATPATRAIMFAFGDGLGNVSQVICNNSINDNNWHNIIATYNNSLINVYIDTVSCNLTTITSIGTNIDIRPNSQFLTIGSASNGAGTFFNGSIDELRIWNRSFSTSEVYEQYASKSSCIN